MPTPPPLIQLGGWGIAKVPSCTPLSIDGSLFDFQIQFDTRLCLKELPNLESLNDATGQKLNFQF